MKLSVEELRAEARRLVEAANNHSSDPLFKKELAERSLRLSERAEEIANSAEDHEIIEMSIRRYKHMRAGGLTDETHRKLSIRCSPKPKHCCLTFAQAPTPNVG